MVSHSLFIDCAAEYAYEFNGISPQLLAAAMVY